MAITVTVQGIGDIDFPDTMSKEEIHAALKANTPAWQKQLQSQQPAAETRDPGQNSIAWGSGKNLRVPAGQVVTENSFTAGAPEELPDTVREDGINAEFTRLRKMNGKESDSNLRALATQEYDRKAAAAANPAPPVDRVEQYVKKGSTRAEAKANAAFDARLEQRLNKPFQEAAPDENGDVIQQGYNPNTQAEMTLKQEQDLKDANAQIDLQQRADEMGRFQAGLTKGFAQSVGFTGGTAAFIGDATDNPELKAWGLEVNKNAMSVANALSRAPEFTQIKTLDDAMNWLAENGGYSIYQAAEGIASGGLGSMAGKKIGKEVLMETSMMYANSLRQTIGSVYTDALEEAARTGKEPPSLAQILAGAVASAGVDTLADKFGFDAATGNKAFTGGFGTRLAKSVGSQMGVQGATEAVQLVPEDLGAGKDPFREGFAERAINEAAVGALGGVGPGAVGAIPRAPHEIINDHLKALLTQVSQDSGIPLNIGGMNATTQVAGGTDPSGGPVGAGSVGAFPAAQLDGLGLGDSTGAPAAGSGQAAPVGTASVGDPALGQVDQEILALEGQTATAIPDGDGVTSDPDFQETKNVIEKAFGTEAQAVSPSSLPAAESVRGKGGKSESGSTLTREDAGLIQSILSVSGRVAGFFSSGSQNASAGAYLPGEKKHVLINVNRDSIKPSVVAGHEVLHAIKDSHPDLYAGFQDAVLKATGIDMSSATGLLAYAPTYDKVAFSQDRIKEMRAAGKSDENILNTLLKDWGKQSGSKLGRDNLFEEFAADLFGNRFTEPSFYKKLSKELQARDPSMLQSLKDMIDKIITAIKGDKGKTYKEADKLIKDLKAVRDAAAAAYAEYSVRETKFAKASEKELQYWANEHPQGVYRGGAKAELNKRGLKLSPKRTSDIGHKRTKDGDYVGAPPGMTPTKLGKLRNTLRGLIDEGKAGRMWYEESSDAILAAAEGDKAFAEKLSGLLAIYSPNATVSGNTTMGLKALYQWANGEPIKVRFPVQDTKAQAWMDGTIDETTAMQIKTGAFHKNLMRKIDEENYGFEKQGATVDMWMARAFGFNSKVIGSAARYYFAEREIKQLAKEIGWEPQQVQAAVWVAIKARVEAVREEVRVTGIKKDWLKKVVKGNGNISWEPKGPEEKEKYESLMLKKALAADRSVTDEFIHKGVYNFATALQERVGQISWEAIPGKTTGMLPGIFDAPLAQKAEYLKAMDLALRDDEGNDLIAKKLNLPILNTAFGPSAWQMDVGAGAQTIVVVPTDRDQGNKNVSVNPNARNLLNQYAAIRGLVLNQEAVVWHYPVFTASKKDANGIQLDFGRDPSHDEVQQLYQAIYDLTGHDDWAPAFVPGVGVRILNFSEVPHTEFHKLIKQAVSDSPFDFGEVAFDTFKADGDYISNDWEKNRGGEDYRQRIGGTGRSDLQGWVESELRPRVERVNKEFAEKYGWDKNQTGVKLSPRREGSDATSDRRDGGRTEGAIRGKVSRKSVSAEGIHYSKEQRSALDSSMFGRGMNGAEYERIAQASDSRIKQRIYFYVNSGKGIRPESDVGGHAHHAYLGNLYDKTNDPLDLTVGRSANQFESAVLDRGFDGYLSHESGVAILLGRHVVMAEYIGTVKSPEVSKAEAAERSAYGKLQQKVLANNSLPMGELQGASWKKMMPVLMPEIDVSHLEDEKRYYRDQIVKKPNGAADPAPAAKLSPKRSEPIFYSALSRAFESVPAKLETQPAAQWKAWLAGNAAKLGVKKDEIQWSGINEYLDMQGKAKVSKDQIVGFLSQNGVKVEEVMKGDTSENFDYDDPQLPESGELELKRINNVTWGVFSYDHDDFIAEDGDPEFAITEAYEKYPRYWGDSRNSVSSPTSYGQWQLPGGKSYKELLLTLPNKDKKQTYAEWVAGGMVGEWSSKGVTSEKNQYGSSHWQEKNILAHVRFNERTDADGNRVLFIEEVQSDWGQDGKKKGFGPHTGLTEQEDAERKNLERIRDRTGEQQKRLAELDDLYVKRHSSVAAAPFVTDTKSWVALAVKRMMRYAADNGFDKVAFINGNQSAERYDLSKQITRLDYVMNENDNGYTTYDADYWDKDGKIHSIGEDMTADELENHIGKELADRVINGKGEKNGSPRGRKLEGLDLKVGGEGMKTFYDKIVPQVVSDLVKKMGGKLETVSLPNPTRPSASGNTFAEVERNMELAKKNWKPTLDQLGFAVPEAASNPMPLFSPRRGGSTGKLDKLIYELQDRFIDLKRIQETIAKTGVAIRDAFNPYLQETLFHGRSAYRVQQFVESEVQPLIELLKASKLSLDDVQKFLHARHAKERNARMAAINPSQRQLDAMMLATERQLQSTTQPGEIKRLTAMLNHLSSTKPFRGTEDERKMLSGMSNDEAKAILDAVAAHPQARIYAEIARKIDTMVAGTRAAMVAYGTEQPSAVKAWSKEYKHYVPLNREMDESDLLGSGGSGTGTGYSIRGSGVKAATGSLRDVENIVANLIAQRETAIVRGEKNMVAKALYGMVLENPNPDLWTVVKPGMHESKIRRELTAMGLDPDLVNNLANAPTKPTVDKTTGLVVHRVNPQYSKLENAIVLRVAGEDRVILFNKENDQAVRLAQALRNDDVMVQAGTPAATILQKFGLLTRYISSINTQYNPVFGLKNLIRDLQEGAINLSSTKLAGKQAAVIADAASAIRGIWQNEHGKHSSQWSALYDDFRAEGGQTGYRDQYNGLEDRVQALNDMITPRWWQNLKVANKILEELSRYNEAIENGIRLSAYKHALDTGMTKAQAADLAKNLTVNFNRKGRVGREAGALYAFFNASAQGTARALQTLNSPAGKKIMAGMVGLGVIATFAGVGMMGDDWDDIPEFIRERDLIIPIGKSKAAGDYVGTTKNGYKYLHIPMALGFSFLYNIGRTGVEMTMLEGNAGKRLIGLVGTTLGTFNPLGGSSVGDKGLSGAVVEMAMPSPLDPVLQLATNKNSFGKPIAMEDRDKRDPTPGFTRATRSASTVGKLVAEGINSATDFSKASDVGFFSPTPDQVDFAIGQVTGGVGRETLKAYQFAESLVTGDPVPESRVPIAGMFYGVTNNAQTVATRYSDTVSEVNQAARVFKRLVEEGKDAEMDHFLDTNPESVFDKTADSFDRNISKLRKARSLADSKEEKARIDATITDLQSQFVEMVREAKKEALQAK
jgi:hypothetical protein